MSVSSLDKTSPFPGPLQDKDFSVPRVSMLDAARRLCAALPAPAGGEGKRAERDRAAIETVAGLMPTDAAQLRLATQFVLADQHAACCLAAADGVAEVEGQRLSARAARLLRESRSALQLLVRLQDRAERRQASGQAAADDWVRQAVGSFMLEALREEHGVQAEEPAKISPDERRDDDETAAEAPDRLPAAEPDPYAVPSNVEELVFSPNSRDHVPLLPARKPPRVA